MLKNISHTVGFHAFHTDACLEGGSKRGEVFDQFTIKLFLFDLVNEASVDFDDIEA